MEPKPFHMSRCEMYGCGEPAGGPQSLPEGAGVSERVIQSS